jgi:hypothetical protein
MPEVPLTGRWLEPAVDGAMRVFLAERHCRVGQRRLPSAPMRTPGELGRPDAQDGTPVSTAVRAALIEAATTTQDRWLPQASRASPASPAPGLMEVFSRPQDEDHGGTAKRRNLSEALEGQWCRGRPANGLPRHRGGAGDGNRTRTVSLEGLVLRAVSFLVKGSPGSVRAFRLPQHWARLRDNRPSSFLRLTCGETLDGWPR